MDGRKGWLRLSPLDVYKRHVHIHMGGIFALVIEIVGEYGGIAPFDGDVVSVHGLIHHKQVGICHGIFGG